MRFKDQLHREIEVFQEPVRIVSLVPSQTELLVDLGLSNRIVGVTKFCVHPEGFKTTKTIVGGTKQVHFDTIKLLRPDLIICNKEENTKEMVVTLENIAPVWVSDIYTIEDTLKMIRQFGELFSVKEKAEELIRKIETELVNFQKYIHLRPIKKVAYVIWKNPYMVAGANTFIDHLLKLNNFENVFSKKPSRYPEVLEEDLKVADILLLATEPFPFKNKDVLELKNTLTKEVRLVDGEYFSWYGSRLVNALSYFKTLHYLLLLICIL
ncbi:ABC transporter substrate-binding protein [Rasiella sp. SM2506]|uniref:ABC transporter substrate-binding protein n=1 Tax=Rasiella sp. SM2506 TaxID=3423914 RepID=UPI003D7969F5